MTKTLRNRLPFVFYLFPVLLLLCIANTAFAQPAITSVSPAYGPAGTVVTIMGRQFSTAGKNVVRFGNAVAEIIDRSDTRITVKAPAAATYGPVSVTVVGGLSAFSASPFNLTFNNGGNNAFNANSFGPKATFATGGGTNPTDVFTADIDDDGKPDVVVANFSAGSISVFRNTSANGVISFGPKTTIATGVNPWYITGADLDGDGKLDIVVTNSGSNTISVLKNTSTPGNISFQGKIDYATPNGPKDIVVTDINLDGRPDIVVANYGAASISVFKNKAVGVISFDNAVTFATGGGPFGIAAADMDGDGKTDIATANTIGNSVSVLKNTSAGDNISFAGKADFGAGNWPQGITIGDINEDGKPDIVTSNVFSGNISVLKNNSAGSISFEPKVDLSLGGLPGNVYIGDINGDNRPDLFVASGGGGNIAVFRNTTANRSLSFDGKVDYNGGSYAGSAALTDMDADGKPDLIVSDENGNAFSVLKNQINSPSVTSFTPTTGNPVTKITITGANFTDVTAVTIGGSPVSWFTVSSPNTIVAVPGNVASGKITVTTASGTGFKDGFTFTPYCAAGADAVANKIGYLILNSLTYKNTETSSAYASYFNQRVTVKPGLNRLSVYFKAPLNSDQVAIFIDLNKNGSFDDPGENVYTSQGSTNQNYLNINFDLPATADSGINLMRVRLTNSSTGSNTTACGSSATGQVQDFGLYIEIPPPVVESLDYTSGVVGRTIQVFGKNLLGATFISFGGVPGTITSINGGGGHLFAKVGAGATGDVVVKTPGGTGVLKNGFTYLAPVISSVSALEAKAGTRLTINGSNLLGATAVSFGGVPARSFEVLTNNLTIYAVVGPGASGDISVTTPGGTAKFAGFKYAAPIITSFDPPVGADGSTIIIKGRNFIAGDGSYASAVSFGGIAAKSFKMRTDTLIEAIVDKGSTGEIAVTTGGVTGKLGGFTFVPTPAIKSFSPTVGTAGTMVTIKGINFRHITAVSFGGVPAQSFQFVSDSIINAVVGYKAGTQSGYGFSGDVAVTSAGLTVFASGFTFNNYCFAGGGSNTNTVKISNVTIDAFSNASSGTQGYENFLNLSAQLHVGENAMSVSTDKAEDSDRVAVFVDFNKDGDFADAGEAAYISPKGKGPFNFNIAVPATAVAGNTRLRVELYGNTNNYGVRACDLIQDQVEDYTVIIPVIPPPVITSFSPTSATGDSTVTILGTGFTGTTSVTFGGVPAKSFRVYSASEIRAVVGPGATGDVSVTAAATAKLLGFTFIALPKPVINSASPLRAGKGALVQITGSGLNWATNVNFGGTPAASFAINSPTSITAIVGDGASGDISVISHGGTATINGFTYLNYCAASGTNNPDPYYQKIKSVSIGALTNNTSGNTYYGMGYINFSNMAAYLHVGDNAVNVQITSGQNNTQLFVYVDFNQDGNFDGVGEKVYASPIAADSFNFNIHVPATVISGATRIRIKLTQRLLSQQTPCGTSNIGQVQDYTVIMPVVPPPVITSFNPSSSSGDSTVTILGTGFFEASNVTFGGVPAKSFVVHSPTEITAILGPGATGDISVTAAGTGSIAGFTYTPLPEPTIISVSRMRAAKGDTVVITGTNFNWATNVYFGGTPVSWFTINSRHTITAVVGEGSTGSVSVVTFGGTATMAGFTYLDYCAASGTNSPSTYYEKIQNVAIGSINNNTATANYYGMGYINFSNISTHLQVGDNAMNVQIRGGPNYAQLVVYIDLNQDGDFDDAGERVYISPQSVENFNFSINIPVTILGGPTRMRVRLANAMSGVNTPCGTSAFGQVQDYTVIMPYVPSPVITSFSPTHATGDSTVIIHGTGFFGVTQVSFGGVPAKSFKVHSTTEIEAVVGIGATGDVSVTASATATLAGFTFIPLPQPVITSFLPARAGSGAVVQITGTGFNWATGVSFGGMPAASFTINSPTHITAVVGEGTSGDVTVITYSNSATANGFTYLSYCAAEGTHYYSPYYEKISRVTIGTINNNTESYYGDSYVNFSNIATHLHTGANAVDIPITNGPNYAQLAVYIDYNQDGNFDGDGETVYISPNPVSHFIFDIQVPVTAAGGATRMRIRLTSQRYDITSPCGTTDYGQTQDYTVILPEHPVPAITSFSPAIAAAGETVTITGSNFTGATAVSFGGVPASSFHVLLNTEITAVVGTGASGSISVTTPEGTAQLDGFEFTPGFAFNAKQELQQAAAGLLTVKVLPNPTKTNFTLIVNGNENEGVEIRVMDMYGRVVHHAKGAANQQYTFGENFAQGMYIAEVMQGKNIKTIKMIKEK